MNINIDILENDVLNKYPSILEILLKDQTTKKNIIWATTNYNKLGKAYEFNSEIKVKLITESNGTLIMPRVQKEKSLQKLRVRNMAEVFTPSWICNSQNNLIDNAWFKKKEVFNKEIKNSDDKYEWETNNKEIIFPKNKTWEDYIKDTRLELACGEAPYITSRYDTVSGKFISVKNRIGILDRKLRVINENTNNSNEWLKAAEISYKSTYAYEWQGDNLLLAREAMLFSFIENYFEKFYEEPPLKFIKIISNIISWNVWQMDGLKGVVPDSCTKETITTTNLFGEKNILINECEGCEKNIITKHNGKYCIIKDWFGENKKSSKSEKEIKFIDVN